MMPDIPSIVGESGPIVALRALIHEYGPTDAPVLIEGESGTGKELVARALHDVATSAVCAGQL